jgi:hypothetical protein
MSARIRPIAARRSGRLRSEETADLSKSIENALAELGSKGILIPEPVSLTKYLLIHPEIIDVMKCASEDALVSFDKRAQLSLEVYTDPEIEDRYITLYVRLSDYDDQVLNRIKKIRKLYESMLADKDGWFLLTTDFRAPR